MTSLSSRRRRFAGVIVAFDPWHRVGGSLAAGRDGPEERVEENSFEYPSMLREALRRNGFQGSGDSAAIRLRGLLTLW